MRDLFNQPVYPKRISLFYEQAAAVVLYLFETGPEAMHAFLSELAAGHGHDAACAAALGIPKEHAVEEFERRWVEWMKRLYVAELDPKADGTVISQAAKTDDPVALPWVNEKDTIASLESWREVPLELDNFVGVGSSLQDWTVRDGRLLARRPKAEGETFLGLRMEESAPVAVRTTVRCLANPSEGWCWFGYVQLDPDGHDTRVVALAPLRDSTEQTVVGIWSDDLAVYLGDQCTGRFPALPFAEEYPEIESPLALVTVGPVSIGKLEIAPIEKFSKKPVVEAGTKGRSGRRRANRPRRPRRRRRRP
ncbi:MAG: hypothetical protein D6788_06765 [Planctomycetota bacterium]|nr:MAG: hypothetical protein D6788_06765 [Planctomycetota bacterium]